MKTAKSYYQKIAKKYHLINQDENEIPIFEGKYVLHCISCFGRNFNDSKEPIELRKVNEGIWNEYQSIHDIAEHHDIILIHESRLPKYVLKNIHGGQECQKMTL